MRLPTSSLYREGRCVDVQRMEATSTNRRGNRVGMYWKFNCPVLETRFGRWGDHRLLCIRKRKHSGRERESEGFIVPFETEGQHNPGRGKEPCFVHATKERRIKGLPCC